MATSKSKIKGITIEFDGNTTKLGQALEGIEKNTKSLQSELKGVNTLLKFDPSNTDLLRQKQELLTKSIDETEEKQRILNETLKKIKNNEITVTNEEFRDLQREIVATEKKLSGFKDEMKDFGSVAEQKITVAANKVKDLGSKIEDAGSKLNKISAVAAAGVTASVITASSLEDAIAQYIATTGKAEEETEKYQKILQDIHDNNYGESFGDIADKMRIVSTTMKDLPDDQLQSVVEKTYTLEDAFGMDFEETLRGINGLMTNMGVSADEAFDLMTVGAQNGLDKTHELGDNLAEYTQIWGQAGFTAQEMFSILQNGLDAGAYNLDKVNDFVKEFTISLSDGRIKENLSSFSDDTQKLFKEWEKGKATSADVFKAVINDLKNAESEQEALTTASTIWSALGEDNALSVITSLNDVNETYQDTTGAINKTTETMYDTTSNEAQTALRKVKTSAAELSKNLLPNLSKILDVVNGWIDKFNDLDDGTKNVIMSIALLTSGLSLGVTGIGKMVTGVGNTITVLGKLSTVITNHPVMTLATVIGGVATAIGLWIEASDDHMTQLEAETEEIKELADAVKEETDAYLESVDAREKALEDNLAELDYYQKLYDELQTIVDQNGKVKKGYEDRASFIVGQLNDAMGLEIEMVGDTIKEYDNLTETFEDVLAKKKAMLILESQEEAYIEALKKKEEAEKKVASAQADVINKQKEIQELEADIREMEQYSFLDTSKAQEQLEELWVQESELKDILWDQEEVYKGYVDTINMYEENLALSQEKNYDKMMASQEEYFWFQAENNNATEKEMYEHYLELQQQLEKYKADKETLNNDIYDKDIEQTEKQLSLLEQNFIERGLATKYGIEANTEQLITGLENMINQATGKSYEFRELGDGTIQMYIDGIAEKEPIAQEEFKTFATNLINELDISEEAKISALNTLDGFNVGFNDKSKQAGIFKSVSSFSSKVLDKMNEVFDINSPSKKTQKIGEYVDEGLKIGIESKTNDILKSVDSTGQSVLNRMQKVLSSDISIPDVNKNVLVNATTDLSSSKALTMQGNSVNELMNTMNTYMPEILKNMKSLKVVLDSKTLVGEIAPQMDNQLGIISSKRKRGRS